MPDQLADGTAVGHNLVRLGPPSDGSRIHRAECVYAKRAKNPLPWKWAEGLPLTDWTRISWLHACQVCRPDLPRSNEETT